VRRYSPILLFVLAILVLGGGFWLLQWLSDPAQAETLGVGIQEGLLRRALRQQVGAYLDAVRRGDEEKALELWVLPVSSHSKAQIDQLDERRRTVTRQLIEADLQARWSLLEVEWWSPNCCESGTRPASLGTSADGARLLVQVYHQDGTPSTYTVDIFDAPGEANWGQPQEWQIRDIFQGGQEPLYWRRVASPQVKDLP
jgi:hypothetical protein